MFDDIGGMADDSGDQKLAGRELDVPPYFPLMLMADVAGFHREGPGAHLEHRRGDVLQRQIGRMRTVPATPAYVVANPVLGQAAQTMVKRFYSHHRELPVLF